MTRALPLLLLIASLVTSSSACRTTFVSDEDVPHIDDYAMSLRLDRRDLNKLYQENIDELMSARILDTWDRRAAENQPASIAIFPMRNETSEHIGTQLEALLSKFETDLMNHTSVDVIDRASQPDYINEIADQHTPAYDPSRIAAAGREVGAQYVLTGKVYDSAERVSNERRVQYFMFIQIVDVSTGIIKFQNEAAVTKGMIR